MDLVQSFRHQKWLTLAALAALLVSTVAGFYGLWGLLFIYWGLLAIRSGQTFLIEPVGRAQDPAAFWLLTILWIGFGAGYILTDILSRFGKGL